MRLESQQASAAALYGLSVALVGLTINYLPLELVIAAQHRLLASGDLDASAAAVDAAIVLGYSVEVGSRSLPGVILDHTGCHQLNRV
jgi:hypothetical protein